MKTIKDLDELLEVYEEVLDKTPWTTLVVHNRWQTISLIDSDEDGDLFYQRIPTDDEEDVPSGYVDKVPGVDTGWPLTLIFPDIEEAAEPCTSQMWSWDYFRTEQVDPYWMRCDELGPHGAHKNSETGATWTATQPAEQEQER